jgi:hypothetical protein
LGAFDHSSYLKIVGDTAGFEWVLIIMGLFPLHCLIGVLLSRENVTFYSIGAWYYNKASRQASKDNAREASNA